MFVKLNKSQKNQMYREAGFRERSIMNNAKCVTSCLGRKDCVKVHATNGKTAIWRNGHGWVG